MVVPFKRCKGVVEQVSLDLQAAFPQVNGFSVRNLWNMKKWYSFYATQETTRLLPQIDQSLVAAQTKLQQVAAELPAEKLQQAVAKLPFPASFGYVPWGHHILIITKCKSIEEALFYIQKTIKEGWSRNTLDNCIRADYFHAAGGALTNFSERLPASQSDLARIC